MTLSQFLTPLAVVAVAVLTTACGDDDADRADGDGARAAETRSRLNGADQPVAGDFPRPKRGQTMQEFADGIGATGTQVAPATSVFTPGRNRLAFGVLNDENAVVYAPTAVYVARGADATEVKGPYVAPADLLVTEPAYRSRQAASEEDPFAAVYAADGVQFDRAGKWVLLAVSKVDGRLVAAPSTVTVARNSEIPDTGEKVPVVETDTVASAGRVEEIDTRVPPAPELHQRSFKEVVGKKPVALLFATPQFCQSRVCGPVVDVALQLRAKYGDRVEFIHQEVYQDNDTSKGLRPSLAAFGLQTEPWLFAIDDQGRVAARLEGSFGLEAFERAVQAAIARSAP